MLNSTGNTFSNYICLLSESSSFNVDSRKYDLEKEYNRMKQAGIFTSARPA